MHKYLDIQKNHLLATLTEQIGQAWLPKLELVELRYGDVIYESGDLNKYVYFPTTSVISVIFELENGGTSEISVVGCEGAVGISVFMGGASTNSRAIVQHAGFAYRMLAQSMKSEFSNPYVMKVMLLYTMSLISDITQTAVCNRHHNIEQQVCRWLLMSIDRVDGDEIVATQEYIAHMLGIRREGVTDVALKLQKANLIKYSRGHIHILDRHGIEMRSCECYGVVSNEYDRLLPGWLARRDHSVGYKPSQGLHVDSNGQRSYMIPLMSKLPPNHYLRNKSSDVCHRAE